MNNDALNIRFANESDLGTIVKFIKELAAYEELGDQVKATEDSLRESVFVRRKAEILIAEYEGSPIGYALFFFNFSTFVGRHGLYIEDIYITPDMRKKGYGKKLFAYLADYAAKQGCGRMEWACLDWNAPSIAFYKSLGAKAMEEWTVYRLNEGQLDNLRKKQSISF